MLIREGRQPIPRRRPARCANLRSVEDQDDSNDGDGARRDCKCDRQQVADGLAEHRSSLPICVEDSPPIESDALVVLAFRLGVEQGVGRVVHDEAVVDVPGGRCPAP